MYIEIEELKKQIPNNDYNNGACDMLEFIAKKEGREDSETKYFKEFYKDMIDNKVL